VAAESEEAASVAQMNLACAWLNLGRSGNAFAALEKIPPGGVPPTRAAALAYLKAAALARLGKLAEARELAASAASESAASLDGFGDILVQPLAKDLLNQLPAPPAPPTQKIPFPGEPKG